MKTLIIGYGNRNRRDDGAGWYVVERLQALAVPNVDLVTAHQLEVDMAETVSRYDTVFFVDAAIPETPHAVVRVAVRPNFQSHSVAHYLTPADVLALSSSLYGAEPHGFLFSIRGMDFNFGETLTPAVQTLAEEVVREIRQMLALLQQPVAVHA